MTWFILSFILLYIGAFWGYGKALKDQEALKKYTKRGQ